MKDSICCRAIFIPNEERLLNRSGLRAGLIFYWNSIHTLESLLHA